MERQEAQKLLEGSPELRTPENRQSSVAGMPDLVSFHAVTESVWPTISPDPGLSSSLSGHKCDTDAVSHFPFHSGDK